jgi:hypothetical protein
VVGNHERNVQVVQTLAGHGKTNQTTTMSCHEVDRFGRDLFCCNHEVTFIFAVLVIDDDDHTAVLDFDKGVFNRCEMHRA